MLIPATALRRVIRECFERLGVQEQDALAVADALIYANLRGIESHGVERAGVYMARVKAGLAGGSERLSVVARHGALCRLDARHALGPAAGVKAVDLAVDIAREHGVGLVAVGNATHFGAAGFYALRAAQNGFVAIVTTNAFKRMAPYGAAEAFLGSNPLAIALPLGEHDEFLLDMSSTLIAQGKIRRARAQGLPIEHGVALDAQGNPTTDPAEALAGIMLPVGGAKGSGLAMAIGLLSGILAGADFDDEVASVYEDFSRPQNLGQLFIVIDPSGIADPAEMHDRLTRLGDRLHALRPAARFDHVTYPGEGAAGRARERSRAGIPMELAEIDQLASACIDCGLHDLAAELKAMIDSAAEQPASI